MHIDNTLPSTATLAANPEAAISFAIDHLADFEIAEFLQDHGEGKDLEPWLVARTVDLMEARGDWSGHDRLRA